MEQPSLLPSFECPKWEQLYSKTKPIRHLRENSLILIGATADADITRNFTRDLEEKPFCNHHDHLHPTTHPLEGHGRRIDASHTEQERLKIHCRLGQKERGNSYQATVVLITV
jgi:hypothetical protein